MQIAMSLALHHTVSGLCRCGVVWAVSLSFFPEPGMISGCVSVLVSLATSVHESVRLLFVRM